jgi:hypothetical protein
MLATLREDFARVPDLLALPAPDQPEPVETPAPPAPAEPPRPAEEPAMPAPEPETHPSQLGLF